MSELVWIGARRQTKSKKKKKKKRVINISHVK